MDIGFDGISMTEIEEITLSYFTYQGGDREGEPLEIKAIEVMVKYFGYGPGDPKWNNYHDVACEQLSDIIKKIKLLNKCKKGNGGANIRIPMS